MHDNNSAVEWQTQGTELAGYRYRVLVVDGAKEPTCTGSTVAKATNTASNVLANGLIR